jgi:hypothetical protein
MKIQKKRGWIFGGAAALVLIGTLAQLSTSRAQSDAAQPASTNAVTSTNLAPAELPKLPADLSPGLAEVIKLAQSNVGDEVIINYVKTSGQIYKPTADEILYLNDLGVSQEVISSLMQSGKGGERPEVTAAPATATPVAEPMTAEGQQQIPTPPSNATLSSPEVPTYSVTQDAPLGGSVQTPPPDVAVPAQATTTVVEQTPPPEVTVNYFYDSLAPYGSWVYVEGYGRCWRPTVAVVNAGWRPYCDNGYWVNTDSGWYWRSYYSWGWAPFHYGRWCTDARFGWVWIPDCTWGPAWVAWRSHDRYCGWAPLPPYAHWRPGVGVVWTSGHGGHVSWGFGLSVGAFTFVGYDRFCDPHPWRHQAPRHEVVNIYNHSTVINNTVIVKNTTIINNGIPRERIVQATHKPVPTYALKDTSNLNGHGRVEKVGGKPALEVYRPNATVIAKAAPKAPSKAPVFVNTGVGRVAPAPVVKTQTTVVRTSGAARTSFGSPKANTTVTKTVETKTTVTSPRADANRSWPGANVGGAKATTPATHPESTKAYTPRSDVRSTFTPRAEPARPATPAPVHPVTPAPASRPSSSYQPPVHSTAPAVSSTPRASEAARSYTPPSAPARTYSAPTSVNTPSGPRATPTYGGGAAHGGGGARVERDNGGRNR